MEEQTSSWEQPQNAPQTGEVEDTEEMAKSADMEEIEQAADKREAKELQDASENDEEKIDADAIENEVEEISDAESIEEEAEENTEAEKKQGFFSRLVAGLTKTRDSFVSGIDSIFSGFSAIDDDFYEEIEEILIMGDIGVRATQEILENLQQKVKENHIKQPEECKGLWKHV